MPRRVYVWERGAVHLVSLSLYRENLVNFVPINIIKLHRQERKRTMKNSVRIAMVALLTLLAGVEYARAQANPWRDYNDGTLAWQYKVLSSGTTCKIKPADKSVVKGEVTIPREVQAGGAAIRVTEIAREAFKECKELTKVTIPEGVTQIGQSAFEECTALVTANIPEGVVTIGQEAFKLCAKLQDVVFPSSLRELQLGAFFHCNSLTKVVLPEGMEEVGRGSFQTCTHLVDVSIPMSVKKICDYAFAECARLKKIVLPESVESIEQFAFEKCTELATVNIPEGVKSLESGIFQECKSLTSITIPRGVKQMDKLAFNLCSGLKEFKVAEDNETFCSVDGVVFSKDKKTIELYPRGRKGAYVIPDGVETIAGETFGGGCTGLDSVFIPSSVKYIRDIAFGGSGLKSLTIPSTVESVEGMAFTYCESLKEVCLLADVSAFSNASDMMFLKIASDPILYVRPGEADKVRDKEWVMGGGFTVKEMHEVTFDAQGGEPAPATQYVKSDDKHAAIEPTVVPTKSNYTFKGWFLDGAATPYDFSTLVKASITLKAKWEKNSADHLYKVLFTVHDDDLSPLAEAKVELKDNTGLVVHSKKTNAQGQIEVELKDGDYTYEASHAGCDGAAKGNVAVKGKDLELSVTLTLKVYTVTFNADNGTLPYTKTVKHGKKLQAPEVPSKKDCEFLGWFYNDKKYEFTDVVTGDMELTARWKVVMQYTVTFDAAGGTPEPAQQRVKEGEKATRPADPAKAGYKFLGWYLSGALYAFDTPVKDNILLVAQWEFEGLRTVTFDAAGGTPVPPQQQVKDGAVATRPADPAKPGYEFKGWYLKGVLYNFDTPVRADITLEARWSVASGVQSELLSAMRVVGNPVGSVLVLEGVELAERVEVYSAVGALVCAQSLRGEVRVSIAASGWASGVYVVRAVARDGARVARFVKR